LIGDEIGVALPSMEYEAREFDHAVDIHSARDRAIAILGEVVRYRHAAERPADHDGLARV